MSFMTATPTDIPELTGDIHHGAVPVRKRLSIVPGKPAAPSPDAAAVAVRDLNAAQMEAAQEYLFRLGGVHSDLDVINDLAGQYPELMVEARSLTRAALGTPAQWSEAAMLRWSESDWSNESRVAGKAPRALWNLVAAAAGTGAAAVTMLAGAADAAVLVVSFAASLSVLLALPRPSDIGVPRLHPLDAEQLQNFVAEAVFADLLETRGVLPAAAASALRRGWDHIRFIAATTQAMSTPPFDFAALSASGSGQAMGAAA